MKKILCFGFEDFLGFQNVTAPLVRHLAEENPSVTGLVLPNIYDGSFVILSDTIRREHYDAVIGFGLNFSTDCVQIEDCFHNLDDCWAADATGVCRTAQPIVPSGPDTYGPLANSDALLSALIKNHIPAQRNQNAGNYICNHVSYLTRQHHPDMPFCFIHVPPLNEHVCHLPGRKGFSWKELCHAGQILCEAIG